MLNMEAIAGLKALQERTGKNILTQLVDIFSQSTPGVIEAMKIHLKNEEYEDLARAAHSLKSSCGNLGVTKMSEVSALIEEAIIDKEDYTVSQLQEWIDALAGDMESSIAELKSVA